jgi:hypothetical protein
MSFRFSRRTFLIIVGLFIIIGIIYFALKDKQTKIQSSSTSALSITPTPSKTSDWIIYNNKKFNYSFKYPKNWQIADYNHTRKTDLGNLTTYYLTGPCSNNVYDECKIDIEVTNLEELSIKNPLLYKYIKNQSNPTSDTNSKVANKKDVFVGGNKGISYNHLSLSSNPDNDIWEYIVSVEVNKIRYSFILYPNNKGREIFDQVLSTFKFTN